MEKNIIDTVMKSVRLCDTREATVLLNGASLLNSQTREVQQPIPEAGRVVRAVQELQVSDRMICTCCSHSFNDRTHQVEHYKGDWHRYNLRQKLRGRPSVYEQQFKDMTDDVSSISGSGSESEGEDGDKDSDNEAPTEHVTDDVTDEEDVRVRMRRTPRVYVQSAQGELLSVYRVVLYSKKNQPETEDELLSMVTALPSQSKWLIVMLAGGHFAAAIYDGEAVVCHKTFHRYVVRAKGGTVQSARDNQGNAPKSVGAHMRRHHEAALTEDIRSLLAEWSADIRSCDRIFLRATGSARQTFLNNKNPLLDKRDTRIRLIPFPTRRPTYRELQRVWANLSEIQRHGVDPDLNQPQKSGRRAQKRTESPHKANVKTVVVQDAESPRMRTRKAEVPKATKCQELPYTVKDDSSDSEGIVELGFVDESINFGDLRPMETVVKKPRRKKKNKTTEKPANAEEKEQKPVEPEVTPDPYAELDVFFGLKNELYTAVKTRDTEGLSALLPHLARACTDHSVPIEAPLNRALSEEGTRLLHLACREGARDAIWPLLQHGADPSVRDGSGQLPYVMAGDKGMRSEFRRFMAQHPDKYDYTAAQVPAPLSEEQESERRARDAEKRKTAKKQRQARLKGKKEEEKKAREEEAEKQRYLNLSDREKRALAAEKRLLAQAQQQGTNIPSSKRCFQCGADMTGKVPFEYSDNSFCSPKCLKTHRHSVKPAS